MEDALHAATVRPLGRHIGRGGVRDSGTGPGVPPVRPTAGVPDTRTGSGSVIRPEEDRVDGAPVTVSIVGSRAEADLIVGLLVSHGLRAAVATDDAGGQQPQWDLDGVRVLVPASDVLLARRLLEAGA